MSLEWSITIFQLLLLSSHFAIFCCDPVNVALNKKVDANITCGSGEREAYVSHSQRFLRPSERIEGVCLNETAHPPSAMVDGSALTWWQSSSRTRLVQAGYGVDGKPEAIITIDLEQEFQVESITLQMGDSQRPNMMAIEKSSDGINFQPWINKVTEEADCAGFFKVPVLASPVSTRSVICQSYGSTAASSFENITISFSTIPTSVAKWKNVQYIRLKFYKMDITMGINGDLFQHYTVQNLEVLAECVCNGHQVGCVRSNKTLQFECVCGGNTRGKYCQQCLPFYNQQAFAYGVSCQACNCFGHSTSCYYNSTVANFSLSMDAAGKQQGGGVCLDCQHNTTGINCEKCMDYHYRPRGVAQTAAGACLPCRCHPAGVRRNLQTGLTGDCVMNNDTIVPLGMKPGDCFCKSNVSGSRCDQCKPGFFNLSISNPTGCQECRCDLRGTLHVGGSTVCSGNVTGQCPCKVYVTGRRCDECLDSYYGLQANKSQGCTPCSCDVGGASTAVCDKSSGQCHCRPQVEGRQCKRPKSGFYYPDLHFISGEFEDLTGRWSQFQSGYLGFGYSTVSLNVSASASLSAPVKSRLSGRYHLLLRYSSPFTQTARVTVTITGKPQTVLVSLLVCAAKWCHLQLGTNLFNISQGQTISVKVSAASVLYMDRAVALPVEFINPTAVLGTAAVQFGRTCDVTNNNMKLGTPQQQYCLRHVFSLTTYYLDGAVPCDCHKDGAYNASRCEAYTGQCRCKPGVTGRRCDQCHPGYYGLSATGCTACSCVADHKICNRVTGQCVCPPNTSGQRCDRCQPNHWKWNGVQGCQSCRCNVVGSLSLQCNQTTGLCACKPGVGGAQCQQCQDSFHGLSLAGCKPCDCDAAGSIASVCNATKAQCPCKRNTVGLRCELCKSGSFYKHISHSGGCLDCICMGITKQCTSTTWRTKVMNVALANSTAVNASSNFEITSGTAVKNTGVTMTTIYGMKVVQATVMGTETLYWQNKKDLIGNFLGLYGNTVSFVVHYLSVEKGGVPKEPRLMLMGRNNTQFVFNVSSVADNMTTVLKVTIREDLVLGRPVSRGQLLLGLTQVKSILLPAVFYSKKHVTSIGEVKCSVASPSGNGPVALGVEQCQCGPGYSGLSCERCAPGYRRANVSSQGYLGVCVPCNCNQHAATCDPDTGRCTGCQHNTTGKNCEHCQIGFYGEATRGTPGDCSVCPCYSPRVHNATCSMVNNTVTCTYCRDGYAGSLCDRCKPFYYGGPQILHTGTCRPCYCNGNTGQCNQTSGECLDCGNNTTGFKCQRCQDGWFGNATLQSCKPCGCNMNGTNQTVCDHSTGQCSCYPGMGLRICDRCLPNYWGYFNSSFIGCQSCGCNAAGSASLQCDQMGICKCKPNSGGTKCTFCAAGLFGLPHKPCEACACNSTGSIDYTKPCEREFGKCACKAGITGRACDRCERLYIGFSSAGCTQCSGCQYSLGNDTLALKEEWRTYWNHTSHLGGVQQQDIGLQVLAQQLNETSTSLGLTSGTLDVLTGTVANLTTAEPRHNASVTALLTRVHQSETSAVKLKNDSVEELSRLQGHQSHASSAYLQAVATNQTAPSVIDTLTQYNTSAHQLQELGGAIYGNTNSTFTKEQTAISKELAHLTNTSRSASSVQMAAMLQQNQTQMIEAAAYKSQGQLTVVQGQVSNISNLLAGIRTKMDGLVNQYNDTLYNKAHAESLFKKGEMSLQVSAATLALSTTAYSTATQAFEDTVTIMRGTPLGNLPVNTTVDLTGITGWLSGTNQLQAAINASRDVVTNQTSVTAAEQTAKSLTSQSSVLKQEYMLAEPRGQQAVDAITNYNSVIKTLNESIVMALEANRTVMQAMNAVRQITVQDLETQARQSEALSTSLKKLVDSRNGTSASLDQRLDGSNVSIWQAVSQWQGIDTQLSTLTLRAKTLQATATSANLSPGITAGTTAANQALARALTTTKSQRQLQTQTDAQQHLVAVIQTTIQNVSILQTKVTRDLTNFQAQFSYTKGIVDQVSTLRQQTNSSLTALEAKMAALEAKVQRARQLLSRLEQPVSLSRNTYASVSNPKAGVTNLLYNHISVEFQYPRTPTGLVFFTENNQTNEFMSVQMTGQKLVYRFNNGNELTSINSSVNLCIGCWFRVAAVRYGNLGHLVVTKLSTGGSAVNYARSKDRDSRMTLRGPIYVGGLPSNLQTKKLTNDISFEGCIYNLHYDGQRLPLWTTEIQKSQNTKCCGKPQLVKPATVPAVSFDGWGYLVLDSGGFSLAGPSLLAFQFRTFGKNAVLVLVDTPGSSDYYGVYLQNGKVVFETRARGVKLQQQSKNTYSNGKWVQVTAGLNSTHMTLSVNYVNQSLNAATDLASAVVGSNNFTSLINANFTFGGLSPATKTRPAPVHQNFAGAMQGFQHTVGNDTVMVARVINSSALTYHGVQLTGAYKQVISGIGFRTGTSYAKVSGVAALAIQLAAFRQVHFDLMTSQSHGVLFYAQSATNQNVFVYVALLGGSIMLQYNQGAGLSSPLILWDTYVANGIVHSIQIDMRYVNSPRIVVDGRTLYGASALSPPLVLAGGTMYIGGVPNTVSLHPSLPVRTSLLGGMRQLKINAMAIDLFSPSLLPGSQQQGAYLSGLAAPPSSAPPLPFTTTPAPPTTPQPTCAAPHSFSFATHGVRFGTSQEGYFGYSLAALGLPALFNSSFTITVELRAVQPNGIVVYAANSASNPSYWFALYLSGGHLVFSMDSNSPVSNVANAKTKGIRSRFQYNDGNWWEVTVLRINDFIALVITKRRDYKNNGVSSVSVSHLDIKTNLYLGGVPRSFVGLPFTSKQDIDVGNVPFHGCIRKLRVSTHNPQPVDFDLSKPTQSVGTSRCYDSVRPGVFFMGNDSYLTLTDASINNFNVLPGFSINVTFSTTAHNTTLAAVYSLGQYVLMEVVEGVVRAVLSNLRNPNAPFIAASSTQLHAFTLCDNRPHTVLFTILRSGRGISLRVDADKEENFGYPGSFGLPTFSQVPIYIGGVRSSSVVLPAGVNAVSFSGCMQSVEVNTKSYALTQAQDQHGVTSGCPFEPGRI